MASPPSPPLPPLPLLLLLLLLLPPASSLPSLPSPPSPPSRHFWWTELAVVGGSRPGQVWEKQVHAFARAKEGLHRQGFQAYGPAPHLFVRYSAYRFSPNKFFVIGQTAHSHLDAYRKSQIFSECLWIPGASESDIFDRQKGRKDAPGVRGTVKTTRSHGHHNHVYEPVIVECEFAENVGGSTGGLLFLQPASAPRIDDGYVGLELSIHPMLVFHEEEYDSSIYDAKVPLYKYEYAHCGPPVHDTVLSDQVGEWYHYHYELLEKNVHFLVYDVGGMNPVMEDIFLPYTSSGDMTIVDATHQSDYDSFYFSQVLLLNDCIHRARYLARWVFNFDVDEYLVVRPPQTLKTILDEANDKHAVSFGTLIYNVRHCLKNRQPVEWKVEHMVYREEKPVCITRRTEPYPDNEWGCEDTDGRRKWIVNPRKVGLAKVHEVPNQILINVSENSWLTVNARQAWLGHYRRITLPPEKIHCEGNVSNSSKDFVEFSKYGVERREVKYVFDRVIKDVARRMRKQRESKIALV